ncbi:hypothetical protein TVAG_364030 [Trichomonas vaginalis G3]|uniref:Cleavage/polyadenylation specificity factor A subunit C-terminal domain-containing protein n=1 Tax=Trichomonas vaginalis (strain ATCC PRA-98 / G3) TaxID=412133 RepID=A2EDX2_TRIV3|nr:hypothetical protein TVAGG3_0948230 [Trichomonas vaginalis G3]EAY09188.1 hypothetical protein TVAG_364030 [Trichomonas vaginalis G3]KAI5487025.1 hypothetical protein TVAGG3_0948230 [Trichomonas vaginalis G3]|eukprot:XP_001321411.1 hypothetical protein [Trichomonas vaginalis G3]
MSRGNEILTFSFSGEKLNRPVIRQIFGNISRISVIEDVYLSFLAVLLDNETFYLIDIKNDSFRCVQKSHISGLIGEKTKPIIASSEKCIITHTRKRTLTIFTLNQNKLVENSFNVNITFSKIYGIVTTPGDETDFAVLGRDFSNGLLVAFFKITDNDVSFVFDVNLDGETEMPYITKYHGYLAAVCHNKTVTFIEGEDKFTTIQTKIPEIVTLTEISDSICLISDAIGQTYTAVIKGMQNMEKKQLALSRASEIIRLPHNFYLKISQNGDSNLLKFFDKNLIVFDTFAAFSTAKCMLRNMFVTKDGKVRSIENGSDTTVLAKFDITNGSDLFSLGENLVLSTFDKTVIFDKNYSQNEFTKIICNSRTLCLEGKDINDFIQITKNQVLFIKNSETILNEIFDSEIYFASISKNLENFVVADSKKVTVYYHNTLKLEKKVFDVECSCVNCDNQMAVFNDWKSDKIYIFSFSDFKEEKIDFDQMITSLLTFNGEIYLSTSKSVYKINKERMKEKITDNLVSKLKIIDDKPFIVGNQSGFITEKNKVEYLTANYSIDCCKFNDLFVFLTEENCEFLKSDTTLHHSHLVEYYVKESNVTCFCFDENDDCPFVFGVFSQDHCEIISPRLKPFKLKPGEVPCKMEWIKINQKNYLAVLSSFYSNSILTIYSPKLEKISEISLSGKPHQICFVDKLFIAVAHGHLLSIISPEIEKLELSDSEEKTDKNLISEEKCQKNSEEKTSNFDKVYPEIVLLKVTSTVPGRSCCSSLTSPNSCFVIYGDEFSNCVIYSVINGIATEVTRDITTKKLKFACAISNDLVLALEKDGTALGLKIIQNRMKIDSSFNVCAEIVAGFSSPPVTFSTKSGSIVSLFNLKENQEKTISLYRAMRSLCFDICCETNMSWRNVIRNGKEVGTGKFVDGDLLLMFNNLNEADKNRILRNAGLSLEDATKIVDSIQRMIDEYRLNVQKPIKL